MSGLLLVVALVAGCSESGGSSSKSSAATFTQDLTAATAAFRAQTDQIKADGRLALDASDASRVLAVYQSLRDATADAAQRYHALTAPSDKSAAFADFLANIDGQRAALDQVVAAAKKKDSKTVGVALRRYAELLMQWAAQLGRLGGSEKAGVSG